MTTKGEAMSTPQRITPECQPVFPCWLWDSQASKWFYVTHAGFRGMTHWHPDQPTAPEPVKEPTNLAHTTQNQLVPTHPTAEAIAKEAAGAGYEAVSKIGTTYPEEIAALAAIILTAAAKIKAEELDHANGLLFNAQGRIKKQRDLLDRWFDIHHRIPPQPGSKFEKLLLETEKELRK
jgi:hypothetical protein